MIDFKERLVSVGVRKVRAVLKSNGLRAVATLLGYQSKLSPKHITILANFLNISREEVLSLSRKVGKTRRIKTMQKRYGVSHNNLRNPNRLALHMKYSATSQAKRVQTIRTKYNADNPMQCQAIQEKHSMSLFKSKGITSLSQYPKTMSSSSLFARYNSGTLYELNDLTITPPQNISRDWYLQCNKCKGSYTAQAFGIADPICPHCNYPDYSKLIRKLQDFALAYTNDCILNYKCQELDLELSIYFPESKQAILFIEPEYNSLIYKTPQYLKSLQTEAALKDIYLYIIPLYLQAATIPRFICQLASLSIIPNELITTVTYNNSISEDYSFHLTTPLPYKPNYLYVDIFVSRSYVNTLVLDKHNDEVIILAKTISPEFDYSHIVKSIYPEAKSVTIQLPFMYTTNFTKQYLKSTGWEYKYITNPSRYYYIPDTISVRPPLWVLSSGLYHGNAFTKSSLAKLLPDLDTSQTLYAAIAKYKIYTLYNTGYLIYQKELSNV